MDDQDHTSAPTERDQRIPAVRALLGGALMGLANLVPGVSGGTMLVAAGVYDRFIQAIADTTRLRLNIRSLSLLALVVGGAIVAIGGGAKLVSIALSDYRWQTYCVFIGLTIGGIPAMVRFCRPINARTWAGALLGGLAMLGLVLLQQNAPTRQGGAGGGLLLLVISGAAGAGAMILPGVSGAYLLLLLGQYRRIIDAAKDAASATIDLDLQALTSTFGVLAPVAVGVVIGIVGISNMLRLALRRARNVTLGVLLGLLIAAPLGLWPFKEAAPPQIGDAYRGETVTEASLAEAQDPSNAKHWAERAFTPSAGQVVVGVLLIAAGAAITLGVSSFGTRSSDRENDSAR